MEVKGFNRRQRRGKTFWVVDFWYIDAKGVWQRFRRDAEIQSAAGARAEADRRRLLAMRTGTPDGTDSVPVAVVPTLDEFWTETFSTTYLATDYTAATAERYRALYRQLSKEFGDTPLNAITLLAWKHFEASLKKRKRRRAGGLVVVGVKVRPFAAFMRTLLSKAVELKVIRKDEAPEIPLPQKPDKLPDAPSEEEVAAWLAVKPAKWITLAVVLAVFVGMRMGELRELRRSDLDLKAGVVRVRRAMSGNEVSTTKGKKERLVPLHPSLRAMLAPMLDRLQPNDLVLRNRAGKQPSRQAVLTAFKALCRAAGTREWSFHSLRHNFVTTLLRLGGSAIAVQQLAGHTKLETTERYAHGASAAQRRQTILLLPPMTSGPGTGRAVGNGEETAPEGSPPSDRPER
jgi:integrase